VRRPTPGPPGAGRACCEDWGMAEPDVHKDYYRVLGVPPDADQETIGRAYRRLMREVHPDARRGRSTPDTGRRVAELVEAWRVLGDPRRRSAYDRARGAAPTGRQDVPRDPAEPGRRPTLEVEPRTLDLGRVVRGNVVQGRIRVVRRDGTAASLELLDRFPPWASVSRSGTESADGASVVWLSVRVDTAGLDPGLTHEARLVFRLVDRSIGWHSQEEHVLVRVTVDPRPVPRLVAEPGGWVVKPASCDGPPRSLILHLFLSSSSGSMDGTLHGDRWMRALPERFVRLGGAEERLHIVVELDCQDWSASGWVDGRLEVSTAAAGMVVLPLIADRPGRRPSWVAGRWGRATAAVIAGVLPAIPLLAGWGPLVSVLLILALGFALPLALSHLGAWEWLAFGPAVRATSRRLGPLAVGGRFVLLLLIWGLLGMALRASAHGGGSSGWGAPGLVVGVFSGMAIPAGLVAPSWLHGLTRAPWPGGGLAGGAACALLGLAWSGFGGLLPPPDLPNLGGGSAAGAVLGWLLWLCLLLSGDPTVRDGVRAGMEGILRAAVPLLGAAAGLGAALGLSGAGLRLVAPGGGAGVAGLHSMMAESLDAAWIALTMAFGLILGFAVGLLTVAPVVDLPSRKRMDGSTERISTWAWMLARSLLSCQVEGQCQARAAGSGARFPWLMWRLHWTAIVVGLAVALLSIYATGHILLVLLVALGEVL